MIALTLFAIYNANGRVSAAHDPHANACLAATFANEGRLSFAPSAHPSCFDPACYSFQRSTRHDSRGEPLFVSAYGPGAGLAAAPVAAALHVAWGEFRDAPEAVGLAGKIAASLLCAVTAAILFGILRTWIPLPHALGLAFAYGLATTVWSASSQALWQHASASFFLAGGIWARVRQREGFRSAALAGLALAASATCRPTMAVFLVAVGVATAASSRRAFLAFVAGALPVVGALALYNLHYFGSPLRFGYLDAAQSGHFWETPWLEGLAGILVSPSRGLLVYTPFVAAGFLGAVEVWRRPEYASLRPFTVGLVGLLAIHSRWTYWWGGHSWGPRILGELLVPLIVFIGPTVEALCRTAVRRTVFSALVLWSLAVQAIGVAITDSSWNARRAVENGSPVRMNIDDPRYRWRLWSVRDNQIGYEIGLLVCGFRRAIAGSDRICN